MALNSRFGSKKNTQDSENLNFDIIFNFQVVCSSVAEETETTVDSRKREQDNNLTTSRRPESTTEPSEGRTQNNNHNSSNNSSFSNLEFLQITPTTIQVKYYLWLSGRKFTKLLMQILNIFLNFGP